jgi:hypothetical protein
MNRIRAPLSYSNVTATISLFVALGGSSYAAVALTKNSVRSEHIASGEVKRSDIGANAVNAVKVADFSLLAKDFKSGQLPSAPRATRDRRGRPARPG